MFNYLTGILVLLSVAVLLAAALLGPDSGPQAQGTATSATTVSADWCAQMEAKANPQWREGDFQRFARECLE